jgi:hypothetical protein
VTLGKKFYSAHSYHSERHDTGNSNFVVRNMITRENFSVITHDHDRNESSFLSTERQSTRKGRIFLHKLMVFQSVTNIVILHGNGKLIFVFTDLHIKFYHERAGSSQFYYSSLEHPNI